jgi:hypothetical protein
MSGRTPLLGLARLAGRIRGLRLLLVASCVAALWIPLEACGSCWPAGSCQGGSPNGSAITGITGSANGYSEIVFWNCNKYQESLTSGPHRPVSIWLHDTDSSPWQLPTVGPLGLEAQYNSAGSCPYNEDGTYAKGVGMSLAPQGATEHHIIEVAVVDQGLSGCGVDDPSLPNCLLEHFSVAAGVEGAIFNHIVTG